MCDCVPGEESAAALRKIIEKSRRIVFFGGAGVSTESGIPDFRSPEGLYAGDFEGLPPEMILSKSFFYLHPERFSEKTNEYLRCANCTEKLCVHKKQLKSLWKHIEEYSLARIRRLKK